MRIDDLENKLPLEVMAEIMASNARVKYYGKKGVLVVPIGPDQYTEKECTIVGYASPYLTVVYWEADKNETQFLSIHPESGAVFRYHESNYSIDGSTGVQRDGHWIVADRPAFRKDIPSKDELAIAQETGTEFLFGTPEDLPRAFVRFC